jgi:hypothetical protein
MVSSMVYLVLSDASYLSESGARSRAGPSTTSVTWRRLETLLHTERINRHCLLIRVRRGGVWGTLHQQQRGCDHQTIRTTLADLGYPQPRKDAYGSAKQKRSKAVD